MKTLASFVSLNLLSIVLVGVAASQSQTPSSLSEVKSVPRLVHFSGVLHGNTGPAGWIAGLTFSLYADEEGGAPLWVETQNVAPDSKGSYSVQLGATKTDGLPLELFSSGEARWLGVRVNGGEEQARVLLLSVPYAMKAADAATLGGLPPSAFMLAAPSTGGATSGGVDGTNAVASSATTPPPTSSVTTAGGTANTIPLFTTATNIQNSILTQTATSAINVGGKLILPATGSATSSKGFNSQPQTFVGSAFNSGTATPLNQKFQWQVEPANNDKSNASGTLNLLYGSGTASPAETGLKINNKGQITFASGQIFPGGSGTVKSVGLSAPSPDFNVSGSPVTTSGTLGLTWKTAPASANTASAIVKRDASGGFSAGSISATQLTASGTVAAGALATSGVITGAAMGLGTSAPTERLDMGIDGNIVIRTDPGNDSTQDNVGYKLTGRDYFGDPHTWSIFTAPVGGGFGVPANSMSVWEYPPFSAVGCCVERFTILPVTNSDPASYSGRVTISPLGWLGVGTATPGAVLDVAGDFGALFESGVEIGQDLTVKGCIYLSGGLLGGTCASDARLKKNIQPYPAVLDKLVQLQPVSYDSKAEESPRRHFGGARISGLIAQDVEKVFPEMISADKNGFKQVNYGQLPYLMLQAIRELKAENDSLREQVNELAQLRKEVERLAARASTNDEAPVKALASAKQE